MKEQAPADELPLRSNHNTAITIIEYGLIICITCLSITATTLIFLEQLSTIW